MHQSDSVSTACLVLFEPQNLAQITTTEFSRLKGSRYV